MGAIHLHNDTSPKAGLVYSGIAGGAFGFGVGVKALVCQTFHVHHLKKIL